MTAAAAAAAAAMDVSVSIPFPYYRQMGKAVERKVAISQFCRIVWGKWRSSPS
jgi:hypothetical protein